MFGIGFTEFTLIFIVAILFLGPDKLPGAITDIAKLIKGAKKAINDAKDSIEEEIKVADLKKEALNYKKELNDATKELEDFKNLRFDDFDEETTYAEEVSERSPMESISAAERHRLQVEKDAKIQNAQAEAERKAEQLAANSEDMPTQNEEIEQKQEEETITFKRKKVAQANKKSDEKSDDISSNSKDETKDTTKDNA